MSLFSSAEKAGKLFAFENPLTVVTVNSILGKSINKAVDDDDNEILGFIPNPGDAVATIFGVPVGTQFGTAVGMEGWGALFVDIITDPTIWLSIGAIIVPEPTTTAGGVGTLSAQIAKHLAKFGNVASAGAKVGKIKKAQAFLNGLTLEAKTKELSRIFKTAGSAVEHPEIVQKLLKAAQAGNTDDVFRFINQIKDTLPSGKLFKLSDDVALDLNRLLKGDDLRGLQNALDVERALNRGVSKKLGGESRELLLNETVQALRYGFMGPGFLKKPIGLLNQLPGVEHLARGTNIVTSGTGKLLLGGFKLTGGSKIKQNIMDGIYEYSSIASASRTFGKSGDEVGTLIEHISNEGIISIGENGANIAKAHPGLFNFTNRVFKAESDALAWLGSGGRKLRDTIFMIRTHGELSAGADINQLDRIGGEFSGMRNTSTSWLRKIFSTPEMKAKIKAMSILKQDETYDDQLYVLDMMLASDGIHLNQMHKYVEGGSLAHTKRAELMNQNIPGFERTLAYADDVRYAPTKQTEEAYELMRKTSEIRAQALESSKMPVHNVNQAMTKLSPEQVRAKQADDVFKGKRSDQDGVMYSPQPRVSTPERALEVDLEIARVNAYRQLNDPLNQKILTKEQAEKEADRIFAEKPAFFRQESDEAQALLRAESDMTYNTSTSFRRSAHLVGYSFDPLSRVKRRSEFFGKWSQYYSGSSTALMNHNGLTRTIEKVSAQAYANLLRRQGVAPEDIDKIIAKGGGESRLFSVSVADKMVDDIVTEAGGDTRAGGYARKVIEHYLGNHIKQGSIAYSITAQVNKYQVATKLTFLMSALTNLGQIGNVLIDSGFITATRAVKLALDDILIGAPGIADELGTIAHASIRDFDEGLRTFGGGIETVLEVYGFSALERFNRRVSTYAGILTAEAMERAIGVKTTKKGWESLWGVYDKTVSMISDSYKGVDKIKEQLRRAHFPETIDHANDINKSLPSFREQLQSEIIDAQVEIKRVSGLLDLIPKKDLKRLDNLKNLQKRIDKATKELDDLKLKQNFSNIDRKAGRKLSEELRILKDELKKGVRTAGEKKELDFLFNKAQSRLGHVLRRTQGAKNIQTELDEFITDNTIRSIRQIEDEIAEGTFKGFTKREVKQIATETVNAQQFRTGAFDVAEAFNNPFGAFIGIFMKFQFKQSEFFIKRVIKPGVEWLGSGGTKGNIKPLLMTFNPLGAPVIGEVTNDIKAFLNDQERPDDISERIWENYLAIGGAGFFTSVPDPVLFTHDEGVDMFEAKALLGANVGDLIKFSKALGVAVTEGEDDLFWEELMKDLTHPLPLQLRRIPRKVLKGLKDPKDPNKLMDPQQVNALMELDFINDTQLLEKAELEAKVAETSTGFLPDAKKGSRDTINLPEGVSLVGSAKGFGSLVKKVDAEAEQKEKDKRPENTFLPRKFRTK